MRRKLLAAALALSIFAPTPVLADPNPGDACSPNGLFQRTGGAESSGAGNIMVCSGGTWKALIGFDGTANVALNYAVSLTGDLTPAQITANQNDYNPSGLATASVLRLSTDASRDITGIAGGADGRVISVLNVGSSNIVLKNQSTSSTATNRFALGADITIAADQSVAVIYDATSQRWRAAGLPFDSAAGGGCTSCSDTSVIQNTNLSYAGASDGTYHYVKDEGLDRLEAWSFNGTAWNMIHSRTTVDADGQVMAYGGRIYLADGLSGVRAFTFNGTTLSVPVTFNTAGDALDVWTDGTYVYVADTANGVVALTFDGTTWAYATGAQASSTYNTPGDAVGIWGDGTYIYVADGLSGVRALSFNGTAWTSVGTYVPSEIGDGVFSVGGGGGYIYASVEFGGTYALSFNGTAFTELDWAPFTSGPITVANGVIYSGPFALTFDGTKFGVEHYYTILGEFCDTWTDGTSLFVANCDGGDLIAFPLCTP